MRPGRPAGPLTLFERDLLRPSPPYLSSTLILTGVPKIRAFEIAPLAADRAMPWRQKDRSSIVASDPLLTMIQYLQLRLFDFLFHQRGLT